MQQGALIQDGCVVAERRLRLGCSLYQRDESLHSLSPPPIIGVDTRRWGRLLVGYIVPPIPLVQHTARAGQELRHRRSLGQYRTAHVYMYVYTYR